jgi:hypothetical protein
MLTRDWLTHSDNHCLRLHLSNRSRSSTAAGQAFLDDARAQLDAKNANAAQATLDRMKKRFARGSLVQERELLRIEVYKARGRCRRRNAQRASSPRPTPRVRT